MKPTKEAIDKSPERFWLILLSCMDEPRTIAEISKFWDYPSTALYHGNLPYEMIKEKWIEEIQTPSFKEKRLYTNPYRLISITQLNGVAIDFAFILFEQKYRKVFFDLKDMKIAFKDKEIIKKHGLLIFDTVQSLYQNLFLNFLGFYVHSEIPSISRTADKIEESNIESYYESIERKPEGQGKYISLVLSKLNDLSDEELIDIMRIEYCFIKKFINGYKVRKSNKLFDEKIEDFYAIMHEIRNLIKRFDNMFKNKLKEDEIGKIKQVSIDNMFIEDLSTLFKERPLYIGITRTKKKLPKLKCRNHAK